jgi:hypothetical protein
MVHLILPKNSHRLSKEVGPAFLILILSIAFSIFSGEFAFLRGWESLYRGFLRFFRTFCSEEGKRLFKKISH